MSRPSRRHLLLALATCAILGGTSRSDADPPIYSLLGEFGPGWNDQWKQKNFGNGPNEMRVVDEAGNRALQFHSATTASGLWKEHHVEPVNSAQLSWKWKISRSLPNIFDERTKQGDDYAARVFVIFESSWLPWNTRAICYVWSAKEPVGSVYPSPYAGDVATFVLRSGDDQAGGWVHETRDIVSDHTAIFGRPPEKISAFAVMVDTDNTGTETTTCFDDLFFSRRADGRAPSSTLPSANE